MMSFIDCPKKTDGKLLLMAPVDPTFLLVPFLEAVSQVSCRDFSFVTMTADFFQKNNSSNSFRTLDDILDSATTILCATSEGDGDVLDVLSPDEIASMASIDCIEMCMKKICEVKGAYTYCNSSFTDGLDSYFSRANRISLLEAATR